MKTEKNEAVDDAKCVFRFFCQGGLQTPAGGMVSVSLVKLLVPIRGTAMGSSARGKGASAATQGSCSRVSCVSSKKCQTG